MKTSINLLSLRLSDWVRLNSSSNESVFPFAVLSSLRRALAWSPHIATSTGAESGGYAVVAALGRGVGAGTPPRPYPSIALGVFEATPFEIATAYTLFPNAGTLRPLHAISRLVSTSLATSRQSTSADTRPGSRSAMIRRPAPRSRRR